MSEDEKKIILITDCRPTITQRTRDRLLRERTTQDRGKTFISLQGKDADRDYIKYSTDREGSRHKRIH